MYKADIDTDVIIMDKDAKEKRLYISDHKLNIVILYILYTISLYV